MKKICANPNVEKSLKVIIKTKDFAVKNVIAKHFIKSIKSIGTLT